MPVVRRGARGLGERGHAPGPAAGQGRRDGDAAAVAVPGLPGDACPSACAAFVEAGGCGGGDRAGTGGEGRGVRAPEDRGSARAAAGPRRAGRAAAVRLFLDRGAAARGGTVGGVAPVAVAERICRALDGLPLAIELAAARLGTLSAAEIEAHLVNRFRFLAYRRPGADPRHQALRAAMDWSYDLLDAGERRVLAELSAFAGTFALGQAAEVCAGGDQLLALEVIDRLAGKSLVAAEPAEDGTRYRLLETVRYYAADRPGPVQVLADDELIAPVVHLAVSAARQYLRRVCPCRQWLCS